VFVGQVCFFCAVCFSFNLKCVYLQTWVNKHTFHRKRVLTNTVEKVCFSESVLSNTFTSIAV
jgi:hypothetical protein